MSRDRHVQALLDTLPSGRLITFGSYERSPAQKLMSADSSQRGGRNARRNAQQKSGKVSLAAITIQEIDDAVD